MLLFIKNSFILVILTTNKKRFFINMEEHSEISYSKDIDRYKVEIQSPLVSQTLETIEIKGEATLGIHVKINGLDIYNTRQMYSTLETLEV